VTSVDTAKIGNRQSAIADNPLAFIFPGQGSQQPGMGKDLAANFGAAKKIFEEADDALGFALSELCFNGPAERLQLTENTQPAILTVSIAALRAAQSEDFPPPTFVAGHSLGEYSALVAAGALSFADAIRTVRARGRYMQEAVPPGEGSMAAVLGADPEVVDSVCAEASQGQVCSAANINSRSQIVIAGDTAAVDRAVDLLKTRGAKRAVKLNVSAPFHCALMKPAEDRLAADLQRIEFKGPQIPVVTNVEARAVTSGDAAREALIRQVSQPVRWLESVEFLINQGVQTFIEIGPGKVLSGLVRQIDRGVQCLNIEDAATLQSARHTAASAA
jgi:[acyl-carrier-protein] S-malonyltransferase